jgi:membrane-associated phospholipid phosphatase
VLPLTRLPHSLPGLLAYTGSPRRGRSQQRTVGAVRDSLGAQREAERVAAPTLIPMTLDTRAGTEVGPVTALATALPAAVDTTSDAKLLLNIPSRAPHASAATLATAVFLILCADVSTGARFVGGLDGDIHEWVDAHLSPASRGWWQHIASNALVGGGLLIDILACAALTTRGGSAMRASAITVTAFTIAFGALLPLNDQGTLGVLKAWVHRSRPTPLDDSFAFPSGHTSMSAFCYTSAATLLPRLMSIRRSQCTALAVTAALLAAATGLSRVLGDVHWASDTVAGAAYGGGLALWASALADALGTTENDSDKTPK